ncbi:MAG: TraB/GumN family protein [Cellulophaga sp.]|nr:TraB/GumN family protein [Cellulophaga sp.]
MKKMKTLVVALIAILFIAPSTIAQNSVLYKVEGDNIETSYVFGTVHMMAKKDFLLEEKVKSAFTESEFIVMELDMDDASMQTEMMKYAMISGDDSLQNHMTPEEYKILDEYFTAKLGVGMAAFNKMKPFVISSTAMIAHLGQDMASYESTFVQMATEQKKEIKGLETIAFQMSMFDEQPYEQQIDQVIEMLQKEGGIGGYFDKIIAAYKTQDIEVLYTSLNEFFEDDKAFKEKMLDERNQNWIPQIGELSKENSVFYAVGAGHLGGEEGVISLLKGAGYTVTPVE